MTESTDMGLSPAQSAAVSDKRPQVLVAAAAGSGKTRLLVAAIVRALIDEELPIERLIAVTFTRKAGAELASRVREALESHERPDLAGSLDQAAVGTIDSLCRRLVQDEAIDAAIDPHCRVLEAETAELIKAEVIGKSWEVVAQEADEAGLQVLADQDSRLRKDVVALYERLRGLGQDDPQLYILAGEPEEVARERLVRAVEEAIAAGTSQAKQSASLAGEMDKARGLLDWLEGPLERRAGLVGLRASSELFPSRRVRSMEQHLGPVRFALSKYRCVLAEAVLRPLTDVVNALLTDFHRNYTTVKADHGLVDFADLELKARALLGQECVDGRAESPRGAAGVSTERGFLLVDEFQDTNELQCEILFGLGAERVLMVGDERQSIYRFRGADVDVFKRRRESLGSGTDVSNAGGLHRLDINYRSSKQVLDFINELFSRPDFFGEEFAHLAADPQRVSICPAGAESALPVRIVVTERHPVREEDARLVSTRQAEAEALAVQIRDLVADEGWQQRDIVVLLPTQIEVELYREALLAEGLDVYVVRGKGYYAQEEITDVTSLLRVLIAPHDDLALLSVLRSPLVELSDDALYLLGRQRRARHARSLWEVVRSKRFDDLTESDRDRLNTFLERVERLRSRVGRPGLSRLIDEALSAFSYDLCLLAAPEGKMRFANVRKLMRLADEFESATGPDLSSFLSVTRSMEQVGDREGSAPTLAENENVVRIMTIHQAKGLEFPVVALAGLGADSHRPELSTFVVGEDGRVGVFLKGYRNNTYEDYDPHWGPAADIVADEVRREREEDVRLLYVAMTRAQERLLLVGCKPLKKAMDSSRIGRIVRAAGLSAFPENGETVVLQDLRAAVLAVGPVEHVGPVIDVSGDGASPSRSRPAAGRAAATEAVARGSGAPPVFLHPLELANIPERVSFSALAAYQRCPRRFYLERMLGLALSKTGGDSADSDPASVNESVLDPDEQDSGRDVGILVHRLLEQFAGSGKRPPEEQMRSAAGEALTDMGIRLSSQETERAVTLTLAAWDSRAADRLMSPLAEPEAPFFFATNGAVVTGIMDLIYRDAECWHVTDYKTNALKGRSVEEIAQSYGLQCAVYGLAALRAGAPAVQMELVFLEQPEEAVSVRYTADDMLDLERELADAFRGLRRGEYPRCVGEECVHCGVAKACRRMVAD